MTLDQLRSLIAEVMDARHFWAATGHSVALEYSEDEELRWEIYRGHLLPPAQTRETRNFETWHLFHDSPPLDDAAITVNANPPCPAPLISILRDLEEPVLYVTRGLLLHGFEAYEQTPGVIASRPRQLWTQELVGTLLMASRSNLPRLGQELQTYVDLAIRGVSRLPITSLEAPLPEFALGQLCYLPSDLAAPKFGARWLEFAIRTAKAGDIPALANEILHTAGPLEAANNGGVGRVVLNVINEVFNNTSLTPYTGFADRLVELLQILSADDACGPAAVLDTVAKMLRLLVRHLTAFDLQRFHSMGANYPDALVLEGLLRLLIELCEKSPQSVLPQDGDDIAALRIKRRIRRGLRQAWMVRKQCDQLLVPDAPTSLGENQRVLPAPFFRVPEEQILQPQQRSKRLFVDEPAENLLRPTIQNVWRMCVAELSESDELIELGTALYLDRPLGVLKSHGETDRTPLLSYEAFSRSIAEARLRDFHRWGMIESKDTLERCISALHALTVLSVPVSQLPNDERTGVVALSDARKAADDFIFRRTTRSSFSRFVRDSQLDKLAPPEFRTALTNGPPHLLVRTATADEAARGKPLLTIYDHQYHSIATLAFFAQQRMPPQMSESHGVEYFPNAKCWEGAGNEGLLH